MAFEQRLQTAIGEFLSHREGGQAGDVILFPRGTGHQLGVGLDGMRIIPTSDLPPGPWRAIPVLNYGDGAVSVRLLCGYLQCDALAFAPLRQALPEFIHVSARSTTGSVLLKATIDQMVDEIDHPRAGGVSMVGA